MWIVFAFFSDAVTDEPCFLHKVEHQVTLWKAPTPPVLFLFLLKLLLYIYNSYVYTLAHFYVVYVKSVVNGIEVRFISASFYLSKPMESG
jgi:hypothetical protein